MRVYALSPTLPPDHETLRAHAEDFVEFEIRAVDSATFDLLSPQVAPAAARAVGATT